MSRTLTFIVACISLGALPLSAQVPGQDVFRIPDPAQQASENISSDITPGPVAMAPAANEDLATRVARLEAENRRMLAELQWQREHPAQPAAVPATVESPAMGVGGVTMPEVQSEVKRLMWTKGDFKVVPYGWLWGNSVYSTERTNTGSTTFFVESATKQGESEFIVDARNTRVGLDVVGPRIPLLGCALSGGKVEIDFQGATTNTENKAAVLLRHAYCEVKNDDFRILAGQTWDIISPLYPGMIMYSIGWDGGDIGYRRAQIRGERFLTVSDTTLITFQSSINQNVFTDSITNGQGKGYTVKGEPSSWPIVEGRVGVTLGERKGPDALPITFGVSSHVGQQEFDVMNGAAFVLKNQLANTWSLNADLRIPITHRLGVQAEVFTGANLGAFYGGVGQGIDIVTLDSIRDIGGWCEMWYDWTPQLHSHFGYSIDDPNNADLHATGERSYNQFYFGNLIYDVTKQFQVALEVSSWKTLYVAQLPGESVRCEFMAKYCF